jgi:hypothetical protein
MCTDKLANGGAASHCPSDDSPDFEQPLLYAHGGLQAGKDPAAARDHEAQCSPEDGGATSLRTYFNGLNALSGKSENSNLCLFQSLYTGRFFTVSSNLNT